MIETFFYGLDECSLVLTQNLKLVKKPGLGLEMFQIHLQLKNFHEHQRQYLTIPGV